MIEEELELDIYIDGSSKDHPRRGGIGVIYVWANDVGCAEFKAPKYPGWKEASSQMMELKAAEIALKEVFQYRPRELVKKITVFSDSNYVVIPVKENKVIYYWPKKGWLGVDDRPIEHQEMWDALRKQLIRMKDLKITVQFKKAEAHSGNRFNDMADIHAFWSRENATNPPLEKVQVYGKTISKGKRGRFFPENQELIVRIYNCQVMKRAKSYRYSFEVLSESDKYYGFSGKADSNRSDLEKGHFYLVRFNDLKNAPRFVEVLGEIDRETMFLKPKEEVGEN